VPITITNAYHCNSVKRGTHFLYAVVSSVSDGYLGNYFQILLTLHRSFLESHRRLEKWKLQMLPSFFINNISLYVKTIEIEMSESRHWTHSVFIIFFFFGISCTCQHSLIVTGTSHVSASVTLVSHMLIFSPTYSPLIRLTAYSQSHVWMLCPHSPTIIPPHPSFSQSISLQRLLTYPQHILLPACSKLPFTHLTHIPYRIP